MTIYEYYIYINVNVDVNVNEKSFFLITYNSLVLYFSN